MQKNKNDSFPDTLRATYNHGAACGKAARACLAKACTPRRLAVIAIASGLLAGASIAVCFYWPRAINLSYTGATCVAAPTLLPALTSADSSATYSIEPVTSLRIAGLAVYAHRACITVKQPPVEHASEQVHLAMRGIPFLKKTVTVHANSFPALAKPFAADTPLSTTDTLEFRLGTRDEIFSYTLSANGQTAPCDIRQQMVSCDLPALKLAQASVYDLVLVRAIGQQQAGSLLRTQVRTVEPVHIHGTSIAGRQLVHDAPMAITLQLNKSVVAPHNIRLENRSITPAQTLPVAVVVAGTALTVTFQEPLPRSAALVLTVPSLDAQDGAYMANPFELPFATSGGPKVKSISIGSTKVRPDSAITLTFDSALGAGQNLAAYIKVEATAGTVEAVTAHTNRITIKTAGQGRCMPFTVRVLDGLKNEFGITGGSAWHFTSRTLCQTSFSIGTSVQGKAIIGYRFGNRPNKIIFVGGMHGDEKSSVQILNRWVEQLELNPNRIPAHQTIIVIPNANPDGYAANRRANANNVDLNRNFPSHNWKSGVTMPDKSYWPTGGGTAPLSEPESRALADFVTAQQPRLVLTYHAAGSIVQPNGAGDSVSIGTEYAKKSVVGYLAPGQTSFFDYDTTGAFEDWLSDKHGKPALVVELKSRTSNDYSGHEKALWYIAGL